MEKKALFLMYEGFAEFEVNILSFFLKSKGLEIVTAAIDGEQTVRGEADFLYTPHATLESVGEISTFEIVVVPGGDIFGNLENEKLLQMIRDFKAQGKWLAAICAGTALLSAAEVLEGLPYSTSLSEDEEDIRHVHDWTMKRESDVTVAGKIVTATGSAFIEFAVAVIAAMGLFDEGEEAETLAYYKNQ